MPKGYRVCPKLGCPELIKPKQRYCNEHMSDYLARRGKAADRGYDNEHRRQRAFVAATIAQGVAHCARCHQPITPTDAWALDHTDDRNGYLGPSHKRCNDEAGGRLAQAARDWDQNT